MKGIGFLYRRQGTVIQYRTVSGLLPDLKAYDSNTEGNSNDSLLFQSFLRWFQIACSKFDRPDSFGPECRMSHSLFLPV